ncbi:MAG: hypothetical protein Q9M94_05215 [Candidatus Gracilibacteria bacterium]|nr:hypothetical protein [Candidatus Gracilibacteria bacterium]MDQ7023125.1 hypothetical protein [Candidatus Gracilibacteria bacterium]
METILFFAFLGLPVEQDLFLYNSKTSENIEYCTNISFDPSMEEKFNLYCNREEVNNYIMNIKTISTLNN